MQTKILSFIVIIFLLFAATEQTISSSFKITQLFEIKIEGTKDKIKITTFMKTDGFIAIGFGRSMYFLDLNVIQLNKDGSFEVLDMYSRMHERPKLDTFYEQGRDDILKTERLFNEGISEISYERLKNTGDKYDKELKNGETYDIVIVYMHNSPLRYHGPIIDLKLVIENDGSTYFNY